MESKKLFDPCQTIVHRLAIKNNHMYFNKIYLTFREMSEIFNIKAILSGPEICNQTTSDELFNLQRACNYTGLEIAGMHQGSKIRGGR